MGWISLTPFRCLITRHKTGVQQNYRFDEVFIEFQFAHAVVDVVSGVDRSGMLTVCTHQRPQHAD